MALTIKRCLSDNLSDRCVMAAQQQKIIRNNSMYNVLYEYGQLVIDRPIGQSKPIENSWLSVAITHKHTHRMLFTIAVLFVARI